MPALRTPGERFRDLLGSPLAPQYLTIDRAGMHEAEARHGEPGSPFLDRKLIRPSWAP